MSPTIGAWIGAGTSATSSTGGFVRRYDARAGSNRHAAGRRRYEPSTSFGTCLGYDLLELRARSPAGPRSESRDAGKREPVRPAADAIAAAFAAAWAGRTIGSAGWDSLTTAFKVRQSRGGEIRES